MMYDVIIVGAGPGGIFSAYELVQKKPGLKIAVFEAGNPLSKRHCPIDGEKVKTCIGCKTCAIMSGFGGAGAFSDGKYNITNDFGGTLYDQCLPRRRKYPYVLHSRNQIQKAVYPEQAETAGCFRSSSGNRYQLCRSGKSV